MLHERQSPEARSEITEARTMVPPAAPELAPVVSPMRRAARRHCGSERALGAHDSNTLRPRIDPQGGELTFTRNDDLDPPLRGRARGGCVRIWLARHLRIWQGERRYNLGPMQGSPALGAGFHFQ